MNRSPARRRTGEAARRRSAASSRLALDPISLEVFNHRLSAIAEEMGVALCRSAFSPNIKERRDYSCAVFDADGALAAQAAHIPVHLGSTQLSVRAAIERRPMQPGDVVILNDPYAGGTHLPDLTAVAPVHVGKRLVGFVANRAHHADIGGMSPGSMPLACEIYQEGLRLPPVYLVRGGEMVADVVDLFVANTRVAEERRGDLLAQIAALHVGAARVRELVAADGAARVASAMRALQDYSERLMRATLRELPQGTYRAVDYMDDDGQGNERLRIAVAVRIGGGRVQVDFAGSAAQVRGGINANFAVTLAAVYYVFCALARSPIPANAGFMRPIRVVVPPASVINAQFPAAVAGGNVETSQRIVDALLRALSAALPGRVPAASCGSMNNLAFGGTLESRRRGHEDVRGAAGGAQERTQFSYYETIAGGAGAGPSSDGASAVHTHMTNTMNTPIEALEAQLPVRVVRYAIRSHSGGRGAHRGGDGIVREIEFLAAAQLTLLTERRTLRPYGARGGAPARSGQNHLIHAAHSSSLPGKVSVSVQPGDRVRIETPGGGGWGRRRRRRA